MSGEIIDEYKNKWLDHLTLVYDEDREEDPWVVEYCLSSEAFPDARYMGENCFVEAFRTFKEAKKFFNRVKKDWSF